MGCLRRLIAKELKELLRDPKVLLMSVLVPVALFVAMGTVVGWSAERAAEEAEPAGMSVALLDLDGGPVSQAFRSVSRQLGVEVLEVSTSDPGEALAVAASLGADVLVVVPAGASSNVSSLRPATLMTYCFLGDVTPAAGAKLAAVRALAEGVSDYVRTHVLTEHAPAQIVRLSLEPVALKSFVVLGGRVLSGEAAPALVSSAIMMSFAPMIVLIFAAQIAAASMGVEKEERTLEVLLSLPVSRFDIVLSKLAGVTLVALLAACGYMAGLLYYVSAALKGVQEGPSAGFALIMPVLGAGAVLVGLATFGAVLVTMSMGLAIAMLSRDVRSAHGLVGGLVAPVVILTLLAAFADLSTVSPAARVAMAAVPFASPTVALKAMIIGDKLTAAVAALSGLLEALAMVKLTSTLLSSELLVTGVTGFARRPPRRRPTRSSEQRPQNS